MTPALARRSALAAALLVTLLTRHAHAESPMSNEMKAEQLFRAGEKNYDSGKYAEACVNFQDSLKLGPKLGTLLNLALCHETVGKLSTAWSEFHYGAAWAAQNNQRDRHEFALAHILSLETRLPRVSLQLPASQAIATLDIDGEPLAEQRWYLPLYLDPGDHVVGVTAPGKRRNNVSFRVVATPNEQLVTIPLLEDDPGAPAPPSPKPVGDPHKSRRTTGYVLTGAGGVAFLAGLGFGAVALGADDADVKGPATASTIAFAAGGILAGAGVYLVLSSGPAGRVGVAPRPGGLGFVGAF